MHLQTSAAHELGRDPRRGKRKPLTISKNAEEGLANGQAVPPPEAQKRAAGRASPAYRGPLLEGRHLRLVKTTECLLRGLRFQQIVQNPHHQARLPSQSTQADTVLCQLGASREGQTHLPQGPHSAT